MQDVTEKNLLRDEEGALQLEFVQSVSQALKAGETTRLKYQVLNLHCADLADLIEHLRPDERVRFVTALGTDFDYSALSELHESVRDQLLKQLPNEQVAQAVRELESDDAVYLLEDLDESEQSDILAKIPVEERARLQRSLDYPEDSAGRIMQADVITVPPFWSVGQTIDYMRDTADLPESFSEIYVVDPKFHPIGTVQLNRILRTKRPILIEEIAEKDLHTIEAHEDQEEVAREFERYDLMCAPVVDENSRLVGVVTVDDIVTVIQEEAEEDIHRLGGVGHESLTDSVVRTTKGRFAWLLVNLLTAILASSVINLFDTTIEQMVALAILMPIVASMGGNAATQTMTVAVRALATRDLGGANANRIISREAIVGLLNGVAFALIMGVVTYVWFGNSQLGGVIAAAMLFNMVVAGLSGILIPLALDKLDIDPAIASGVFVTAVTDVVGFCAFLGLAALWLV